MPRLAHRNPSYRRHRPSGQAVVTLDGRDCYLGPWQSRASRDEYDRLVAEWLAGGRRLSGGASDLTVLELINAYRKHAQGYYRRPDGSDTGERKPIRIAMRPLRKLYGRSRAAEFGPLALKAVRQDMVRGGWCRTYVNSQAGRIKRMFKWAVENEMVPATVYHALQAVTGLKAGRSDARESAPVRPVPDAYVRAVLPHASAQVRAMIELQVLTGMRPGEVCIMRACDVDTTGPVWEYRPATHKTENHGHERVAYLGPKAQDVLRSFLKSDLQAYVFSPAEAEASRRQAAHATRKTPMTCGNCPGDNRKACPKRRPGDRYDVSAYRRAIARACAVAFAPPDDLTRGLAHDEAKRRIAAWRRQHRWHPHRLRHNAGTNLRREYGAEAAQVILGHKTLRVTEIYAERNIEAARRVMGEVG
jgi:integrase